MLTRRRVLSLVALILVAALAWTVWIAFQTARDLRTAEQAVDRIRVAVSSGDAAARENAIGDLAAAARDAKERTDGAWWSALTLIPFVGDDVGGVRDLSASLDLVASDAIVPLGATVDDLDSLVSNGRVDVEVIRGLEPKIDVAHAAFVSASDLVGSRDSSGFAGVFKSRYDKYVTEVSSLARDLAAAETAVRVLPRMLGGDSPRQYLLIFENNAEIRATGGLPGSWALVKANDGRLQMARQGAATDFGVYSDPIGDITPAEEVLFGREMGRFFQDPNFTPDFPRAASVFNAFWEKEFPGDPLDGVVSIDVVSLSYLLEGTGPLQAGQLALTAENAVDLLLSDVYEEPDPDQQNEIFQEVARGVFESLTSNPQDPIALVEALSRSVRERRFHVAPFRRADAEAIAGTLVEGGMGTDRTPGPSVYVALNDATASKMSYYLRYTSEVQAQSCIDGVQDLQGKLVLSQTISPAEASALPDYVTGTNSIGKPRGSQFVRVHLFAPKLGTISDVKINGRAVAMPTVVEVQDRPAVTLAVLVESLSDEIITYRMTSGPGQTADGMLFQTPSVVPGTSEAPIRSAC